MTALDICHFEEDTHAQSVCLDLVCKVFPLKMIRQSGILVPKSVQAIQVSAPQKVLLPLALLVRCQLSLTGSKTCHCVIACSYVVRCSTKMVWFVQHVKYHQHFL